MADLPASPGAEIPETTRAGAVAVRGDLRLLATNGSGGIPFSGDALRRRAGVPDGHRQSTAMGGRIYAAVGFRDLGRIVEYVPPAAG